MSNLDRHLKIRSIMDFPLYPPHIVDRQKSDNVSTVFRIYKYLCKFAFFAGFFPVRGLRSTKSFDEASVKKMSFPFILSLTLGLLVKLCFYIMVPDPISFSVKDKGEGGTQMSITDLATKMVGFMLIHAFGPVSHVLVICRSTKFLPLAKLLEKYLTLHPPQRLKLFNTWTLWLIFFSVFPLVHMTIFAYRVYSDNHALMTSTAIGLFFGGSSTFPPWGYTLVYFVAFTLLEYSTVFFHIQILFPACAISKCVSELINDIEEKFKSANMVQILTSSTANAKMSISGPKKVKALSWSIVDDKNHTGHFWSTMTSRYVQIEEIFVAFEDFVGPYLIASLGFSVVSTVCMIYMATMTTDMWTNMLFRGLVIHGTIAIANFRVSAISTMGEMLKRKHAKLLKAIATKGDLIIATHEKDEVGNFIRLVKALPMKLSAAGYFKVGRQNVTSIINVIITYLIVLQQFKMSEA